MGWVGFMVMGLGGVVMTDGIDQRATVVEKWLWHIAKRLLSPALIFEFCMPKKNGSLPPYFSFSVFPHIYFVRPVQLIWLLLLNTRWCHKFLTSTSFKFINWHTKSCCNLPIFGPKCVLLFPCMVPAFSRLQNLELGSLNKYTARMNIIMNKMTWSPAPLALIN